MTISAPKILKRILWILPLFVLAGFSVLFAFYPGDRAAAACFIAAAWGTVAVYGYRMFAVERELYNERVKFGTLQMHDRSLLEYIDAMWISNEKFVMDEKLTALRSLVAGIAHELNTPLGNALLAVSFLTDAIKREQPETGADEKIPDAVRIALKNIEKTAQLVTRFKELSSQHIRGVTEIIELRQYIEMLVQARAKALKEKGILIRIKCPAEIRVKLASDSFNMIIDNVLGNAIDYALDGVELPMITITCELRQNNLVILIEDNGVGMEPEVLKSMFDPFFTTHRSAGHTGLGLSVAYNLISEHFNGEIVCVSEPGRGASFQLSFPDVAVY